MSKKVIFAFLAGAAAGVAGAYVYLNKKFEERFQKELQSVKDSYNYLFELDPDDDPAKKKREREEDSESEPKKKVIDQVQKDYEEYAKHVEQYTNYNAVRTEQPKPLLKEDRPNIEYITPDEWGNIDEYEECFYTFFTDGIMIEGAIRNEDMIIHEPTNLIGDADDFMPHVNEHEECVLTGVNHQRQQYFEVTFVDEKYNEDEED